MEHIGDDDVLANGLHVKGHVPARQLFILKSISGRAAVVVTSVAIVRGESYSAKGSVIHIHAALAEVSGVEKRLAIDESTRQARVNGAVRSLDHRHGIRGRRCGPLIDCNGWIPSGNRPIDRRKQKYGRLPWCQQEVCLTPVEDRAGWCPGWRVCRVGWRDGHDQRLLGARAVVQRADARGVVRDPPWAARAA